MSGFARALPVILASEGGYVDHPSDPGGRTMKGVTEAVYHDWLHSVGRPPRPVREIADHEVEAIYHARYWRAAKCDALPWPLSLCHFDAAVNHGVAAATKLLQRALGFTGGDVDGDHGPATQAAIEAAHPGTLYGRWFAERVRLYHTICRRREASRVFLLGWIGRMVHLHHHCAGG